MAQHNPRFWEEDRSELHPNTHREENTRSVSEASRTAYDIKALHEKWPRLSDRILKQTPVLDIGIHLREGAVYFDLMRPEDGPFQGMNDREVEPESYLVAKETVDYELWNALIGEQNAYRLGRFAPGIEAEPTLF